MAGRAFDDILSDCLWTSVPEQVLHDTTLSPLERLMLLRLLIEHSVDKEWQMEGRAKFQDHETTTGSKDGDIQLLKDMETRGLIHIEDHYKLNNWGTLDYKITYWSHYKTEGAK